MSTRDSGSVSFQEGMPASIKPPAEPEHLVALGGLPSGQRLFNTGLNVIVKSKK